MASKTLQDVKRFSGHWILGQQGTGKTVLLKSMIAMDLLDPHCSIIVLDAKGDLTSELKTLDFGERLVVMDSDTPFAINPLDVPKDDVSRAVDNLEYIFGALLDANVTPMQKALLRSILRALIIGFPTPTLKTVQDLIIHGPSVYTTYIQQLPDDLQAFFNTEWKDYEGTRSQLKWRMRLVLENDIVRKMFSAHRTRFKISESMDAGNIVVIDNSVHRLGNAGSAFLGRFILAQIWAAAVRRQGQEHKVPVYVYIDEASDILDSTIARIIDTCRSQNIALILAHQRTKQIQDPNVLSALENCAIKMANVDAEAAYFSKLLHIPEERMNQLKTGQFAKHVRGEGSEIVEIPVYEYEVERMDEAQLAAHRMKMHERYGFTEKFTAETQEASGTKEPEASRVSLIPQTSKPEADKPIVPPKIKSKTKWKPPKPKK